jgi:hypothetical protein
MGGLIASLGCFLDCFSACVHLGLLVCTVGQMEVVLA